MPENKRSYQARSFLAAGIGGLKLKVEEPFVASWKPVNIMVFSNPSNLKFAIDGSAFLASVQNINYLERC